MVGSQLPWATPSDPVSASFEASGHPRASSLQPWFSSPFLAGMRKGRPHDAPHRVSPSW
jgi:hypothetical protein